ncbi:MAG TPA: CDP-diacylglycerol--serine O-phosphatidyltransferase [Bacteroidales bacterium]|nr:CDP-diacylglycerol--serine O-phosphatidyltransferase [Bacteroidales bacterium]
MKKHIPNLFTLLNLASGFLAVIFILNDQLITGVWILIAALVFDFLDGLFARLLNAYSDLGKQLDSLADMVSFGVAPGIIIYYLIRFASGSEFLGDNVAFVAVLVPLLAGVRLARFNLDKGQTDHFEGLPTPANAFFIFSLVLAIEYSESAIIINFTTNRWLLLLFTVGFSILMVTRLPMLSLKFRNFRFKGNELRYLFLVSCILLFAGAGFASLPLIIFIYITVSVIYAIIS